MTPSRREEGISRRRRELHEQIDALRGGAGGAPSRPGGGGHARAQRAGSPSLERPLFEGTGELPDERPGRSRHAPASLSDDELRSLIGELEREEDDISLHRRMLHGRIDILRAERERRRRGLHLDPASSGPILGGSPR